MKTDINRSFAMVRVLIISVVLALGGIIRAEEVTQGFDQFNSLSDLSNDGWDYTGSAYSLERETYRSKSRSIVAPSSNSTSYLITPMLQGSFNFWLRNYTKNYQAKVTAFACTFNDGNLSLGSQIGTQTLSKTSSGTPAWTKVEFSSSSATRVALLIEYAYFDDFTYTPGVAAEGPELTVNGFEDGSSYNFGGIPVDEATSQVFVMTNTGSQVLAVSNITVSGGFVLSDMTFPIEIAAGGSESFTVSTPAEDAQGDLVITSNGSDSPYIIHLASRFKTPAPVMTVDKTAISFGRVTDQVSDTFTVSNEGNAPLEVSISCDNTDFSVSPASLTIAAGESSQVTVSFRYDASSYGIHNGVITLRPNEGEVATVQVSAKVTDPDMWTEYFDSNLIPEGWEAGSYWSFVNGVAEAKYNYSVRDSYLTTPALIATSGDELKFDYRATLNNVTVKIQYSKDGAAFVDYPSSIKCDKMADFATFTISGLQEGQYRFRFANDDYELDNFEGLRLNMNAPEMVLSPLEDAVFGKVTSKPDPKTYTVTNKGTGLLNVNIASSTRDFTVEPASLTDIAKGESKTFTVTFNYDVYLPGEKSAVITVTPTYNASDAKTFNASANAKDPTIWEEDFEEGCLPEYWSTTGWNVTNKDIYKGNGTYMAYAGSDGNVTITTPRLRAMEDEELTFEIGGGTDTLDKLTVEYSHDLNNWTELESSPFTESGYKTFVAPETGFYYLRFKGRYASLDNFYGFRLAPKRHDLSVTSQSIPATGNQYAEYKATLTVKEIAGKEETAVARLMIGGQMMAETEPEVIPVSGTHTFELSFIPEEAMSDVEAQIIVTYSDEKTYSETVTLTIEPALVLSENEEAQLQEGFVPVILFDYNAEPGWNVITTPFKLTDSILSDIFGPDYLVFEFKSHADGFMDFRETSQYVAGYPYVVLAYDVESAAERVVVKDVRIEKTSGQYDEFGGIRFHGNMVPMTTSDLSGHYLISNPGNATYRTDEPSVETPRLVETDKELAAYRGYVELGSGVADLPMLRFYRQDGTITGIGVIGQDVTYPEGIYNLNGLKVDAPDTPGIYIINGQKYIVR